MHAVTVVYQIVPIVVVANLTANLMGGLVFIALGIKGKVDKRRKDREDAAILTVRKETDQMKTELMKTVRERSNRLRTIDLLSKCYSRIISLALELFELQRTS